MKKWRDVVRLKNNRTNLCMTKSVFDPLNEYAKFKMRERISSNKGHPAHKSYDEIMDLLGEFDKNTGDDDDQFKGLIPPEIQLQDLEGGMEEGDIAAEAGVASL